MKIGLLFTSGLQIELENLKLNEGVGVGTQGFLIRISAPDYRSRPGSNPGTPTNIYEVIMKDPYEEFIDYVINEISDEKIEDLFDEMGIEINLNKSWDDEDA